MPIGLTETTATAFARIALGHVTRAYPNKLDHVLESDADALGVEALHPIFYGSFDWHSCVHGYWLLARVLRLYPQGPAAGAITTLFDESLTDQKVKGEADYLERPSSRGFERPYGWAWLLMLASELSRSEGPKAAAWSLALQPLAETFAQRFKSYLPKAVYPVRTGVHASTAFAARLAMDYAARTGDQELDALLKAKITAWHQGDQDAQAWEPSGDDFLSPTLMQAEAMRAALPPDAFLSWFSAYLPRLAGKEPRSLFTPAVVSDRSDGKIAHLDGLNLSRAWCFDALAAALPTEAPEAELMRAAAEAHREASLPHVAGDYMGEHWLASFALLAIGGL